MQLLIKNLVTTNLGAQIFTGVNNVFGNVCSDAGDVGWRVCILPSVLGTTGCSSTISSVYAGEVGGKRTRIPLGVTSYDSLFDYDPAIGEEWIIQNTQACNREVTLSSADYVIEFTVTDSSQDTYYLALAVELS